MHDYDRRVKSASWNEAEEMDVDDAKEALQESLRDLKTYTQHCGLLVPLYLKLADALETKEILRQAQLIDARSKDVSALEDVYRKGLQAVQAFEKEFEAFCQQKADGTWKGKQGLMEAVQSLPSALVLLRLGQESGKIVDMLLDQDSKDLIDWSLDSYVGHEAKVTKKIESLGLSSIDDYTSLAHPLLGVLKYYSDEGYIKKCIDER